MRKFAIIFSIFVSLSLSTPVLAAGTTQEAADSSGSMKYVVKANDILSSIASFYHVSVQSIVSLNKMSNPDKLQIGQVILIPSTQKSTVSSSSPTSSGTTAVEAKSEKYIVKPRDTLTSISRAKGVSVAEIIAANKMANPNALQIGQTLIIPVSKQNQSLASRKDDRVHETSQENESEESQSEENESDDLITEIIEFAKEYLGSPYSYSASGPKSFDCSGFTMFVFSHFDIDLPHNSASQTDKGNQVARDELKPGDLVFFRTSGKGISHVGIYIGKGDFIHASTSARKVEISSLSEEYYDKRYVTARRIL